MKGTHRKILKNEKIEPDKSRTSLMTKQSVQANA